jgi:hypothetical protein
LIDQDFPDRLVAPGTPGLPERFFDRFVFNMHPTDAVTPSVLLGFGVYPSSDTADGFAIVTTRTEQRNVRFSTELSATDGTGAGPFRFEVVDPMRTWRLQLGPNPTGLELDVTWAARGPAWAGDIAVTNKDSGRSSFEHLFQSGIYSGTLTLDGRERSVDGWYGQRDRSRGVRTMSGGQGLHIWYQAQFPDRSIGFLLVEGRDGRRLLLEGAVMHVDGRIDPVVAVRHALEFDDLDLRSGTVEITTDGGASYRVETDATAGGGFMSGGGYGGHHGKPLGCDHLEHDVYPLDGSVTQRTLDSSLTDRLALFRWDDVPGLGIFEFALTRSPSYTYLSTLS